MSKSVLIDPLTLTIDKDGVRFWFKDPVTNVLEVPPTFEAQLRQVVETHGPDFEGKPVCVDLENVPALSSRQLGMILTVREIMKPFGRLQLRHVSGSVKHLLQLTGTDRFFRETGGS
jgi:anti-anti-sigma regulatory factor